MDMFVAAHGIVVLSLYGGFRFISSLRGSNKRMILSVVDIIQQEKFMNAYFGFLCQQNDT